MISRNPKISHTSNGSPELSIVCTARNDNHGGDLVKRMALCFNGILELASRHKLSCELIIVEWNPPQDEPKLAEVISWPKNHKYCSVRIIEVPNNLHQKYEHGEKLPLYQMIAKNVGIRRSRGRMVLATNIDILFTNALFEFFASGQMSDGKMYRVDRYDTDGDIKEADSIDKQLEIALGSTVRIGARGGTWNCRTGDYNIIYGSLADSPHSQSARYPLHTNASGDFTLMSRKDWFGIGGYWETDAYSFHLDSILCYSGHFAGLVEEFLPNPMWIHHIEHEAGWTPENEATGILDNRLKSGGIPKISNKELEDFYNDMASTSRPIKSPNTLDWGLAAEQLKEQSMCRAGWDHQQGPLRTYSWSPALPVLPSYNKITRLSDGPDLITDISIPYVSFICSVYIDGSTKQDSSYLKELINRLANQCQSHQMKSELVIANWCRNKNDLSLVNVLELPKQEYLDVRLIQIPESDRKRLRNSELVHHFELLGLNVAARRANGTFLLSVPLGVLFIDVFIKFLSLRRLRHDCFYTIKNEVPAATNTININLTSDEEIEKYFFLDFPSELQIEGHFLLIPKENWLAYRGHPEISVYSDSVDQVLPKMAQALGMNPIMLKQSSVFEWLFEWPKIKTKFDVDDANLSLAYEKDIAPWVSMMLRDKIITSPNHTNWGFGERDLALYDINSAEWLTCALANIASDPIKVYLPEPNNVCQEMIDHITRGTNNPYFHEISANSLLAIEKLIKNSLTQKVIEFGSGSGLVTRICLGINKEIRVVSVDSDHSKLFESKEYLSIDLNRVDILKGDCLELEYQTICSSKHRVMLIFNLNLIEPTIDILSILEKVIPVLGDNSIIVINGVWYSPIQLHDKIASPFFSNNVVNDINALKSREYSFAPYWNYGSALGAGDIIRFMTWINSNKIEADFISNTNLVKFCLSPQSIMMPNPDAIPNKYKTGFYKYNLATRWGRRGSENRPTVRLVKSFCEQGELEYETGNYQAAFDKFYYAFTIENREVSLIRDNLKDAAKLYESGDVENAVPKWIHWWSAYKETLFGVEQILVACQVQLGNAPVALDLIQNEFEPERINLEMANKIRRFVIETEKKYSVSH
ncbi:hypothetical protein OAJ93_00025 [Gammaproteobacteria bacterium]|nr:hypothetical protein [Gammaproteobacteria bacterium]